MNTPATLRFRTFCNLSLGSLSAGGVAGYWLGHFGLVSELRTSLPWVALACACVSSLVAFRSSRFLQSTDSRIAICFSAFLISAVVFWAVGCSPRQIWLSDRVAGTIPFNDAESYYDIMAQWPMEGLDRFNARRPAYAAMCALQGWLCSHELRNILLLRAALLSVSLLALHFAISTRTNWWAASASTASLLWVCHMYSTSSLSEGSGVTFSAMAVAVILAAPRNRLSLSQVAACILLAGSWIQRPINPLFPIAMTIIAARRGRERRPWLVRGLLLVALCASIMVALPRLLNMVVAEPGSSTNSHYAHLILAFAKGTSWGSAGQDLSQQLVGLSEGEAARVRCSRAIELILTDPTPCLRWTFDQIHGSTSAMTRWITVGRSGSVWLGGLIGLVICFLAWFKRDLLYIVPAVAVVALVGGAPLLWDGDGPRTSAALWPALVVSLSLPAYAILQRHGGSAPDVHSASTARFVCWASVALCTILVAACIYMVASHAVGARDVNREFVTIEFDDRPVRTGQWAGPNSAKMSVDDAIEWFQFKSYTKTRDFLKQHRDHVVRIRRRPTGLVRNADGVLGNFVIECKPSLPEGAEQAKLDYSFIAERTPSR